MDKLLENFGVDWKLLLAQVANFVILFFILKRFAYAPIVKMLEERAASIKRGLEDSAEAERRLRDVKVREAEIVEEAQARAMHTVAHAEEIARKKEVQIVEGAHGKAEAVIKGAQKAIAEEKEKHLDDVRREAEALVSAATAKVLGRMEPDRRDEELVRQALAELAKVSKAL